MPVARHYNPKIFGDFETTAAKFDASKYDNWGMAWAAGDVIQTPQVNQWACYVESKYEKAIKKGKGYKIIHETEWLYCYGIGISSYSEFATNLKHNFHAYFHNGGKFDFHFIIEAMHNNGLDFVPNFNNYLELKEIGETVPEWEERYDRLSKENKEVNSYRWNRLQPAEANVLANGAKNIYSIEYVPLKKHYKTGKDVKITLKDSYKLFTHSLSKLGEVLNDTFKTDKYTKLESDYSRETMYSSIEEFEKDTKEFEYLKRDCLILRDFFLNFYKIYPEKYIKLTASSTAYNHWIRMYGEKAFNKWISDKDNVKTHKRGFEVYRSLIKRNKWKTKFDWKKEYVFNHFPVDWLNNKKVDDYSHARYIHSQYYNGGISWVNEKYRGVELPNIDTYDINSSYPSVMNSDALLPHGEPIKSNKIDFNLYQLFKIEVKNDLYN
ncbi:MAG: hypothetical protein E7Y34_01930, partial [Mycoplasma sp.]|nr:hypothetical protein [Mycoplasma sp.]